MPAQERTGRDGFGSFGKIKIIIPNEPMLRAHR